MQHCSVFEVLDDIISLITNKLQPLPLKLERKFVGDMAQLDERYELAKLTHQVSSITRVQSIGHLCYLIPCFCFQTLTLDFLFSHLLSR
jgi:hypothetical protein